MAGRSEDLEIVIGADLGGLAADLGKAARMAASFAKDVDRAAPKPSEFRVSVDVKGIQQAARAGRDAEKSLTGAALGMGKFVGKAAVAGGTLLALEAGVSSLGDIAQHVKESVSMAAEVEQTTLAFEVMLGSAQRATEMLGDLRKFAAETPFGSKDTIDAARQLKAYGIAADQVLPSLRVIGDITAGLGGRTNLSDMAYLFGTLASQGRAFSKDIYQFTNRGVDLLPGLAEQFKVTKAEVMGLVEEGRVGFPEVARALESLRGPGGQFENLMARQSQTLAGLFEQAKDAWDLGKIKLGQIVIEETGLKDAVRDFDAFSKRLTSGLDSIRPAVRFVGDLGRGFVQIGSEIGKAGGVFAGVFGEMAGKLPMVGNTLREIDGIVKGMKDFRIDPADVAVVAVSISKEILTGGAAVVLLVAEVGDAFEKNVIRPLMEAVQFLRESAREMGIHREAAGEVWDQLKPSSLARGVGQEFGLIDPDSMSRVVSGPIRMSGQTGNQTVGPAVEPVAQGVFQGMKDFGVKLKELTETIDTAGQRIIDRLNEKRFIEQQDREAARLAQRRKELEASLALIKAYRAGDVGQLMGGFVTPVDPFATLAVGMAGFRREFDKGNAIAGIAGGAAGLAAAGDVRNGGGLRFPNEPSSAVAELAKELREKYDPLNPSGKLMSYRANLDKALEFKLIKPEMAELGWRDAVKEVADRVGAGGPAKLTEAALAGTHEDARLLSNFFAGQQGPRTTEDLLQQIRDILAQKLGKIAEAPAPRPVQVAAPGGG